MGAYFNADPMSAMDNQTLPTPHDDHDLMESTDTTNLIVSKVFAMVTLGVVSFILGMIPVKISSWLRFRDSSSKVTISGGDKNHLQQQHHHHHHHQHHGHSHQSQQPQPALISILLCFGGGVLLYTTFLHLQPEVREEADRLVEDKKIPQWFINTGLSLSDVVFCCGFFFVYFVEESVHWLLDRNSHEEEEDEEAALHRTMSLRRCNKSHYRDHHMSPNSGNIIPRASLSAPAANGHHNTKADSSDDSVTGSGSVSVSTSTQVLLLRDQISIIDTKSNNHSPLDPQLRMFGGPLMTEEPIKYKGDSGEEIPKNSRSVAKSFRGLLAVLALSFHAVFEGLAVGLEGSTKSVWYMFAAIATHKFVIAFCVGIGLVSSSTSLPLIVVYVATFAMVTPLGIGLGIALSDHGGASESLLLVVVLQGMAAGTLLYVIFFEVLQRERNSSNQSGAIQLAAILAGFCTMLLLQLLIGGHEHHHHHHHHHDHLDTDTIVQGLDYHHDHDGHNHGGYFHNHSSDHFHDHDHDHHDHEHGSLST